MRDAGKILPKRSRFGKMAGGMAGGRRAGMPDRPPRSYSSPIRSPKLSLLTVPPSTSEEMNQSWYSV